MPRKQGEVMWPRLVANKILKKRLGSSNFVADFPNNSEPMLEIANVDQSTLSSKDTEKFKVFISTWNIGGIAPNEDFDIEDLLGTCSTSCDIYVIGFQEIVPLKASNVLGSENSKISIKWNSLIRDALNKRILPDWGQEELRGPIVPSQYYRAPHDFQCIISKQMVGILISVWVRSDLRPFIRHPSVSCVGCGIMGCLGNKGSVSVRFQLHETSFCFVCSHLASGGREGDEKYRNSDVAEIFSRTSFPRGGPLFDLPKKILDHDQVIFLGDLNYRISLPEETTRLLVERSDWDSLLKNDQLRMELTAGNMLRGWDEGAIKFAPTYKYWPNSDVYYGCCYQGKKTEKKRAPAWCDRIIWNGKGLKQLLYTRGESKLSDHRPVKALFVAEVKASQALKNLQSLFLSERFQQLNLEVASNEEFICRKGSSFSCKCSCTEMSKPTVKNRKIQLSREVQSYCDSKVQFKTLMKTTKENEGF